MWQDELSELQITLQKQQMTLSECLKSTTQAVRGGQGDGLGTDGTVKTVRMKGNGRVWEMKES